MLIVQKRFCCECRKDVDFTLQDVVLEHILNGVKCIYPAKKVICFNCNSEIWDGEIMDFNLKSFYEVYEKNKKESRI